MAQEKDVPGLLFSCRLTVALYCMVATLLNYFVRFGLSTAVVCMRGTTANGTATEGALKVRTNMAINECFERIFVKGEFDWDHEETAHVLGAYAYGTILTPAFGGWLACKIGPKRTLLMSIGNMGIASLLVPVAARSHYKGH